MQEIMSACPWCDHVETNKIVEKDLIVCRACDRPYDLYESGETEPSWLWVLPRVEYTERRRVCYGFGGLPTMRTRS